MMLRVMKARLILVSCVLLLVMTVGCRDTAAIKPPPLSPDSRLVALYFDDGYLNQYEAALPALLKYGFRATFGVITGGIGYGENLTKCMGEKELKDLAGYGMEIASHTVTHANLSGNLTDEQLRREIFDSRKTLEKMGFTVRTMVYPCYEYDDKVIEYVREAGYTCARAGWPEEGTFDINTVDPLARYHIPSWQISGQDMASFKSIVDRSSRTSVVCLVYHFISDTGPETTSTTVADFNEQMAYLYNNGFTVVLLSDLLK
jgi:peptidoglycan/xylan/chitin deacetylase (PgdA/CDA1 family)